MKFGAGKADARAAALLAPVSTILTCVAGGRAVPANAGLTGRVLDSSGHILAGAVLTVTGSVAGSCRIVSTARPVSTG